ncbi:TetR/AcrR family transcriptional regulator [Actinosynnema sp. CS-041913]|uniref:TetR/AcrR family transcriptional regulator n=1 Tax=Actinosynnema sp. CS-041913 TaxID=3239917 RepID=UPI003D8D16FB
MEHGGNRGLRADARRNRVKLLTAAAEVFAEQGHDATLDEVCRRAGVGPGTLYRHFPTRQDLLEALLREQVDVITARAAELLSERDVGAALVEWLSSVAEHAARFRGVASVLMVSGLKRTEKLFSSCHNDMFAAGAALVERAKEADALRPDVAVDEVFKLVNAIAWASEQTGGSTAERGRLVSLVLDGLRPRDDRPRRRQRAVSGTSTSSTIEST